MTPKRLGWAGVAVGVVAAYITLPPILLRTAIPSALLAIAAVYLGVRAIRGGERKLGWGAIVVAVAGAAGAVGATLSGEANLERVFVWSALLAAMLRFAAPLIFAALGGVISERSGVVNIGLEGMMLTGAFFAVLGADKTDGWVGGLIVGMVAGAVFGLLHAFFSVTLRADQIVSGVAINLLALGGTGYLYIDVYGDLGTPDGLPAVPNVELPLGWVPALGDALEDLNLLIWIALILVVALTVFLFRTPPGLRVRSVGENPLAADTAGISVTKVRYSSVIASGVLAAMGGAFLSIGFVHSFSENMTVGKGFIALAAMIAGRWHPVGALAACCLFGFSSAVAQRLPAFSDNSSVAVLFEALPYVLTLIVVAGVVGRSRPPAADGIPYERH